MKLYSKSVIALLLLFSVYIPVNAGSFSDTTEVLIINKEDIVPEGARKVGSVKVTDGGFKMNCGYEHTLEEAKAKAIKAGGNIVRITELKSPDGFSSCYRLFGEIYFHPNLSDLKAEKMKALDTIMSTLLPDTASYALLYIYRSRSSMGAAIPYNVMLDDSVVCRAKNNSRCLVKVSKAGLAKISARTESRDEVSIDIRPGKVYFVKCSISMGAFVGRPKINVVDAYIGLKEFNAVKEKQKEERADDMY
ncbi:DUF2846 domain-containing protein [Chitinophaga sp. RAB17]|uniref:DUF2846 domain-containing protein n=1 Tax=Chitinophaga sp. RAB17 TaxID=3233049 RepID=UPI003F8E54AE